MSIQAFKSNNLPGRCTWLGHGEKSSQKSMLFLHTHRTKGKASEGRKGSSIYDHDVFYLPLIQNEAKDHSNFGIGKRQQ